jgi:hypothetical protein
VAAITASAPQAPQDVFRVDLEKSRSVFDRPHRLVANYLYEAPAPWFARDNAVLRQIFGGWQISGVTSTQSGQPFTVFTGVDTNGNGTAAGDRPNFNPAAPIIRDPVTGDFRTFSQDPTNPAFIVPAHQHVQHHRPAGLHRDGDNCGQLARQRPLDGTPSVAPASGTPTERSEELPVRRRPALPHQRRLPQRLQPGQLG